MPGTAIMVSGIAALAGLGGSITLFFVKRARYARWKRTSGTVVELVRCSTTEQPYRESWEAHIEFQTGQGRRIRFRNHATSNPPVAPVGASVAIIYNPSIPTQAIVDKFFDRHVLEFCLLLIGVLGFINFVVAVVSAPG